MFASRPHGHERGLFQQVMRNGAMITGMMAERLCVNMYACVCVVCRVFRFLLVMTSMVASYAVLFDFPMNVNDGSTFLRALDPETGEVLRTLRLASGDTVQRGWKLDASGSSGCQGARSEHGRGEWVLVCNSPFPVNISHRSSSVFIGSFSGKASLGDMWIPSSRSRFLKSLRSGREMLRFSRSEDLRPV